MAEERRVTKDAEIATYEFLRVRKQNYQFTFGAIHGQEVLRDLAKFCRANESCFDPDPRLHALAEGRREVWLRIQRHLQLKPDDLYALATGRNFQYVITNEENEDDDGLAELTAP